mmetsp:Transcript_61952/g.108957  ORF Transcript_61952/g.108957 Transcript_61952/m.108957 type:complete len:1520 (-) Transcript_61952:123-4682(-)
MSGKTFLKKWIGEYNAAVIVTVTSAEAENICLKNGLLFHELLSSFGHLDGLNSTVRTGNQTFTMNDAHIRFERSTEVKVKSSEQIEKLMRETFEDQEMSRMPQNIAELKASPPSSWTPKTEAIVSRVQSFHECEMTSHPFLILTVVATSDQDHVLAMQELASMHHTPACLSNGQYDPSTVQRLFVLLHDAHDSSRNPYMLLQQLQSRFVPANTKLLTINSFPADTPNLQQPDMWSRFLAPRFFPQNIPDNPNTNPANLAVNPVNGQPVLGSRLSMEDFMSLRNFCVDLYNQFIVPNIERRLVFLNKQVNENKKGMKNMFRNFLRRPREESEAPRGQVRYKFDKIESQLMLLADTSFMIKDYETALAMYRLVRDDLKSDKSHLHLAHTNLMIAAAQIISEPGKTKELHQDLEQLGVLLATNGEMPHFNAYYALLAAEMYVAHFPTRLPVKSAEILLMGVKNLQACPLICAMLLEKAAAYYLQASHSRKYVFFTTITANKMLHAGARPARHAAVCFAASMMVLDQGHWGDLKAKLGKALSEDSKFHGLDGARRSLLLLLRLLSAAMCEGLDCGQNESLTEAVAVFREITTAGAWGQIEVFKTWKDLSTRDILLGPLPIHALQATALPTAHAEIGDLPVPLLDVPSAALLHSANGVEVSTGISNNTYSAMVSSAVSTEMTDTELAFAEEMYAYLELERKWVEEHARRVAAAAAGGASNALDDEDTLSDKWAQLDAEYLMNRSTTAGGAGNSEAAIVRVPLGEKVKLKVTLTNKLPVELHLTDVRVLMEPAAAFETNGVALQLKDNTVQEVMLTTKPLQLGKFKIDTARWNLSESLSVKHSLTKPGPLLQRTRQQRASGERGPDTSLSFEVVPAHPLLKMEFEGLSPEVLQGQLLKATLVLRNEGAATAGEVFIKLSQPLFVFYLSQVIDGDGNSAKGSLLSSKEKDARGLLSLYGGSSTVLRLAEGTTIAPGQALRFEAWLMVSKPGLQKVSLLAAYKKVCEDGSLLCFGPGTRCRTSFVSIKTKVLPSLGISLRLTPKPSSVVHFTLLAEIVNYLRHIDLEGTAANEDFGRDRFSSVGQLDIGSAVAGTDEHIEIDDNSIKVMGIWLLGAGVPFRYKPSPRAAVTNSATPAAHNQSSSDHNTTRSADLLACPSERIARCFPVKLAVPPTVNSAVASSSPQGKCSWLLPLPHAQHSTSQDHDHHLVRVIEQFLCIANSTTRFQSEIENSRQLVEAAELEAETLGPRSIAQVRREKMLQLSQSSNSAENNASGAVKAPESAQDLANGAAARNGLTVAAVWACRWEGKLRWGMHKISQLSFVGDAASAAGGVVPTHSDPGAGAGKAGIAPGGANKLTAGVPSTRSASDYLLVGVHHAPRASLSPAGSTDVPVTLRLRSLCPEPLSVTLAALDHAPSEATARLMHPGPSYVYNDQPEVTLTKESDHGMRWNGKTQHIGIVLAPNATKDVDVAAYFTKAGVYDLNRFKISVRFSNSSNPQLALKHLHGQSLITVTQSTDAGQVEEV